MEKIRFEASLGKKLVQPDLTHTTNKKTVHGCACLSSQLHWKPKAGLGKNRRPYLKNNQIKKGGTGLEA
jgi:hypothetical protein